MIRNKNADIIRAIKNKKCCKDVVLESLSVTENDTYTAEEGKAWNEVVVNVEGGGGDTPSMEELLQAFSQFDMYINPDGATLMAADGVLLDNGSKSSFQDSYRPTENAVSVPVENYLTISDMNAFKLLMAIHCNGSLFVGVDDYGGSYNGFGTEYMAGNCVGTQSTVRSYAFRPITESVSSENEYVGTMACIYETGSASTSYPSAYLFIDPNDYTKCLVEPEDLPTTP